MPLSAFAADRRQNETLVAIGALFHGTLMQGTRFHAP
jgi:hypothetical protein